MITINVQYPCGCVYCLATSNVTVQSMCEAHIRTVTKIHNEKAAYQVVNTGKFKFRDYRLGTHTAFNSFSDKVELDVQRRVWNLSKGDIIFDVGAAFGTYTLPALLQGAYVYAFEPNKHLCEILYNNVELNKWTDKCQVFNYGLSDIDKTEKYNQYTDLSTINAGKSNAEARMRALDNVIRELNPPKITMIKVDIEGAELDFLAGACQTLIRYKPTLLIEIHTDLKNKVIQFLSSLHMQTNTWELKTGREYLFVVFK